MGAVFSTEGKPSRIAQLASDIKQNTDLIDEYLCSKRLQTPSFEITAPSDLSLPLSLLEAQNNLLESCTDLQALIEGPRAYLTRITSPRVSVPILGHHHFLTQTQINIFMSLHAIHHYKIATCFAIDEQISYEVVAERCGVDEDCIRRLLRMAISNNIFREPKKGTIAHSAISKLIAEEDLVYQWIGLVCNEMWPAGCKTVPAMIKWPGSEEPNETGFALANESGFWEILKTDQQRAQRFADGMRFLQTHPVFSVEHLFASLGWTDETCPTVIVDIGGSQGSISKAFLRQYPNIRTCYVQDLSEALNGVTASEEFQNRLHFQEHNFFTKQTIKDADLYYLRSILHDWSDKYAIQIIRNLIPALKNGASVMVNEVCLPEPNALPEYHAQLLRYDVLA
jgi:hypothetical protein